MEIVSKSNEESSPLHKMRATGSGMLDWVICSCGWISNPYFDGDVYAEMEWKRHLEGKETTKPSAGFIKDTREAVEEWMAESKQVSEH